LSNHQISPEKVTKPIQLLAAWLTGLIIVNGAFLVAASKIGFDHWSSGTLIVASIVNVPMFLAAIFLLQTKFRPEMQEDSYYSKYLENQISAETGQVEAQRPKEQSQDINDLRENLTLLTDKINTLTAKIDKPNEKTEIEEISKFTNEIVAAFENRQTTMVRINDLLPSYSSIVDSLNEAGIEIQGIFGSSNDPPAEEPAVFAISFGEGVEVELLQKIITICRPLGATHVSYVDSDIAGGKIYIGSYGYKFEDRKQPELNDLVYEFIMSKHISISKLKYLLNKQI